MHFNLLQDDFGDLCSLKQRMTGMTGSLLRMSQHTCSNQWSVELPSVCTRHKFSEDEQDMLKRLLLKFQSSTVDIDVNQLHYRYKFVLYYQADKFHH